jgi:glycosyltransferase involved in cell wall biosynthesis
MKIALAFPGCHRRGGVERIVFECARFLSTRGHTVDVYANEWEIDPTCAINYRVVPMRRHPWFLSGTSFFINASKQVDLAAYDVLNTHGCICPFGGVQWVHSVHLAWLERGRTMRGGLSLAAWKRRLNPLHPALLQMEARHFRERRYRKLTATTPRVRDDLHRLYGVPEEDVVIVPNGFSPTEFNPSRSAERREAMRARLELKPDQVAILFVANELERKGFRTLLAAVAALGDPSVRIVVVGRPPARTVMRMAEQFGLADRVTACGPTADVAGYHAACDLFVLPTQYEAFCLAILESLGSGLPVVTSDVPGARDAIQPGINGALISDPLNGEELAAAIKPLLDPARRGALAARSAASVEGYQWPRLLVRYEAVLTAATPLCSVAGKTV